MHELWLRFLTEINETTTEVPSGLLQNEFTKEAIKYMEVGTYTKEQLEAYDKCRIDTMTASAMLDDALRKGEAIGLEKGKAEGKAEVAIRLLKMGISFDDIMQCTGFIANEIQSLQKQE